VDEVGYVFSYNGYAPVESLQNAIDSFGPDIVIPSCDRSVQHLHELHAICSSRGPECLKTGELIERSLGNPAGFPTVSSRFELLKIAQLEGILVPRTASVENNAEFTGWSGGSAAPWVIKADGTWGGQGVRIARSMAAAERSVEEFTKGAGFLSLFKALLLNRNWDWVLAEWRHSGRPVVAQSFIHGRPANCAVVCWEGNVLASVAVEVIQSRGATGPATLVQLVPGREMIAAASKLARRLGISGFFGLDFMIEEGTGAVYLIEMNPRCTPPCALPLKEGHDLVKAFCARLAGRAVTGETSAVEPIVIAYTEDKSKKDVDRISRLLYPRSRRTVIGRLLDFVRPKRLEAIVFQAESTPSSTSKAAGMAAPMVSTR